MNTPNLRQLEIFLLLMKTRSFTETTQLVHVTQPAVSQALKELEGQLGLELFSRGGGRIRPTDEAIVLLPEVERVFAQVGSFASRVSELRDTRGGKITVATVPVLSAISLPQMITRMLGIRPRLNIAIQSLTTAEVLDLVKSEAVELGFVFGPIAEAGIGAEPVLETRFACIMQSTHPLASRDSIRVSDLGEHKLIVLSPTTPPGLMLRDVLRRHGSEEMAQVATNSASAAPAIIRATGMVAISDPFPILDIRSEDMVVRPFEPAIPLTVAAIFSRHRALPKIALQFVKQAREVFAEQAATLTKLGVPTKAL